jgi:hypothetical protein
LPSLATTIPLSACFTAAFTKSGGCAWGPPLEDRPRYTPSTTFETFPIPPASRPASPNRLVPKNAAAATILKKRTLTALYNTRGTPEGTWLDALHRALDEAVAAAYGWSADITTDDALARLLALNHSRATAD